MTWHVVGAGSLGILWAVRLAQAGQSVRLILRTPQRLSAYQQVGGLTLHQGKTSYCSNIPAELPDHPQPIRRLLLACKAYDALAAVHSLKPRLMQADVVLLQNGLGSQQAIVQALPHARCLFLSSTEGAYQPQPFQARHAGLGQNWLGDPRQPSAVFKDLACWQQAAIPCAWHPNIMERLWHKLALNCCINPLTVLQQCPNGALLTQPHLWQPLVEEFHLLLKTLGHPITTQSLQEELVHVLNATANNYSSMHQDVAHHRRTEVAYLSGYATNTAQSLGLSLPHLQRLHQNLLQYLNQQGLPQD